jgi:hypothetical protein
MLNLTSGGKLCQAKLNMHIFWWIWFPWLNIYFLVILRYLVLNDISTTILVLVYSGSYFSRNELILHICIVGRYGLR